MYRRPPVPWRLNRWGCTVADRKPEKTVELSEEIAAAAEYLERQANAVRFGKITVDVTVHAGRIQRIERATSESFIPKK